MGDDVWTSLLEVMPPRLKFGPGADAWPATALGWCQRCDRPILQGQPHMPRIPFLSTVAGLDHAWCPPVLSVVR